jgi:hypothetical protein
MAVHCLGTRDGYKSSSFYIFFFVFGDEAWLLPQSTENSNL